MQQVHITNQSGLKLHIQVDTPLEPKGLVFIAHGQKGSLQQVHIQAFTDVFLKNSFRVVRFDATHALGKSEGDVEKVTYDTYISDLEDVIDWARTQAWFSVPFALCGHSMGAQSTTWYAEHHPAEVSLLLPMAPTINYDLWESAHSNEEIDDWKRIGYQDGVSRTTGKMVRVGWQVNESLKKFDILANAHTLTMPILNIVGEYDAPCPVKNQQVFMDAVHTRNKSLIILPGLEHSYRDATSNEYTDSLKQVTHNIDEWLQKNAK